MSDECYQEMYSEAYKGFHRTICGISIGDYNWYRNIEPGHLVMEVSTVQRTDTLYRHRIGYLIGSSKSNYIIELLDGEQAVWEAALFIRVPTDVLLVAPCIANT